MSYDDEGDGHPEHRVNQQLKALKKEHARLRSLRHSMDDELVELVDRQRKQASADQVGSSDLAAKYNI